MYQCIYRNLEDGTDDSKCGATRETPDIKNKLLDMVGEGEGGMIERTAFETYTLPCVKEIANGVAI